MGNARSGSDLNSYIQREEKKREAMETEVTLQRTQMKYKVSI